MNIVKYVIIMTALANHNSFWTYTVGVDLGVLHWIKIHTSRAVFIEQHKRTVSALISLVTFYVIKP